MNEKLGFPLLQGALRRSRQHLWEDTSCTRNTRGQKRWEPPISEYQQAAGGEVSGRVGVRGVVEVSGKCVFRAGIALLVLEPFPAQVMWR